VRFTVVPVGLNSSIQSSLSPYASVIPVTFEQEYSLMITCPNEKENEKINEVIESIKCFISSLVNNITKKIVILQKTQVIKNSCIFEKY
jgi:hypothetical protein